MDSTGDDDLDDLDDLGKVDRVDAAAALGVLSEIDTGLDRFLDGDLLCDERGQARRLIARVETVARRVQAAQVAVMDAIDRSGVFAEDGHGSAKNMVRFEARLSRAEAAGREKCVRVLRDLPEVATAYRKGRVGTCQVRRLGRAHSNARVRQAMLPSEERFLRAATSMPYDRFDLFVGDWVRKADEDGTVDTGEANHERRTASILQEFNGGWRIEGSVGSLQGSVMADIWQHFVDAEFEADWAAARAEHGDAAHLGHIQRTDAQRRADALFQIFQRAATAPDGQAPRVIANIVIDQTTFERQLARFCGVHPGADDPDRPGYRCSDLDGRPIDPAEAALAALTGHVRRVVVGADSVVIDKGRLRRLFTGHAATAVRLSQETCYWPGCTVPTSRCQIDHLEGWADTGRGGGGGSTGPGNGGPACGKHNRLKQHGFRVVRDPGGEWHVYRPDGEEIVPAA